MLCPQKAPPPRPRATCPAAPTRADTPHTLSSPSRATSAIRRPSMLSAPPDARADSSTARARSLSVTVSQMSAVPSSDTHSSDRPSPA